MAMDYGIAAIPTRYKGILFRSRLEARWAAFFDLAGWKWEYEPFDLNGWIPDFRVTFPCGHSECGGRDSTHTILCEVKPFTSIAEFEGHPCMDYPYGSHCEDETARIPADASAALGYHPRVSFWEMGHGSGGGVEDIQNWIDPDNSLEALWNHAGELVRYRPS